MQIDLLEAGLYLVTAIALLGSPGPGIAALVAIGKTAGFRGGLPFFIGLQIALAAVAGMSAFGLFSLVEAFPALAAALTAVAAFYLLYLAWKIASAPVGDAIGERTAAVPTMLGGMMLGAGNPKAYAAFASLMSSYTIASAGFVDAGMKWLICVAVIIAVDLAWLYAGAVLGVLRMSTRAERIFNIFMGLTIIAAAGLAFL